MPRTAVAHQLEVSSSLPSEVNSLIEKGSQSWLSKNEVAYILQESLPQLKLRGLISQCQPHRPSGGSMFLIDKVACRFFRNDGHNYEKRPDGKTVRETHEKLKVGDVELINCYYAHQPAQSCDAGQLPLARRCYWLLDAQLGTVVLVHYLNSAKKGGAEEEGVAGSGGRRGASRKRAASASLELEYSEGEESASGGSSGRRPRASKRTAKPARRTKRRHQAESDEEDDTDPEWEDESEDESSFELPESESEGEQEEGGTSEEEDTLWQLEEEQQQLRQQPPVAAALPPVATPRAPVKPQRPPPAAAAAAAPAAAVLGSPEPHLVYVPRHLLLRRFSSWRLPGAPGCGAGAGEGEGACAAGCNGAAEQGCGGCGADGRCHCNCAAADGDAAPSPVTADSREEALAVSSLLLSLEGEEAWEGVEGGSGLGGGEELGGGGEEGLAGACGGAFGGSQGSLPAVWGWGKAQPLLGAEPEGAALCPGLTGDSAAAAASPSAERAAEVAAGRLQAQGSVASVCGGWQREEELAGRGMGRLESTLDFEGLVEDAFL